MLVELPGPHLGRLRLQHKFKGRRKQSYISVPYSRGSSTIEETHRLQSHQRVRQAIKHPWGTCNMSDRDMIYVAAMVWAGRKARLRGGYLCACQSCGRERSRAGQIRRGCRDPCSLPPDPSGRRRPVGVSSRLVGANPRPAPRKLPKTADMLRHNSADMLRHNYFSISAVPISNERNRQD